MDDVPSTYEWFEQCEGRASERAPRLTFLLLFTENGRPGWWLIAVALVGAAVAGLGLGEVL